MTGAICFSNETPDKVHNHHSDAWDSSVSSLPLAPQIASRGICVNVIVRVCVCARA